MTRIGKITFKDGRVFRVINNPESSENINILQEMLSIERTHPAGAMATVMCFPDRDPYISISGEFGQLTSGIVKLLFETLSQWREQDA